MEHFKLSQSVLKSQEELGGFAISIVISTVLFTLFCVWAGGPDAGTMVNPHVPTGSPAYKIRIPDPHHTPPIVVGLLIFCALILLNVPPVKRLPGFVQYLVSVGISGVLNRRFFIEDGIFMGLFLAACYGVVLFIVMRVNWWFYWDCPSNRSVTERMLRSIIYTGLPFVGLAMGFWRLLGLGVRAPTTALEVTPSGETIETIPESPALAEHARRMAAVRGAQAGTGTGHRPAENKDSVSGSI